MGLNGSSLKALSFVLQNRVKVSKITSYFIFFDVDGVEVRWDLRKGIKVCLCIHECWRDGDLDKICYHIKAVEYWLNKHQDFKDWIEGKNE